MIRIISSRKLRFYSPDKKENIVTEGKNIIQDLPDWVAQDDMFKLAKNSGIISILSTRSIEKVAENSPEKVVPQSAHEAKALLVDNTISQPTLEPGGGAEIEEPEFPANDQNDGADHLDVEADAKKAARKAARAARKAKKDK